jgi:predicted nucleic acid-binding protein
VSEFVLDASFALHWCFEDEATAETEAMLTLLQNQERTAFVPGIFKYEMLNALGKGVTRERLNRNKAVHLWQEIQELPIRAVDVPVDEKLLDLALLHNLAVYDASYLSVASSRKLPLATVDGKLQAAAEHIGMMVIRP